MQGSRTLAIAYGLLAMPLAFGALPIYLFIPDFYAQTTLLSLSTLGAVLLGTRLLDAFADPLLGVLSDSIPRRLFLCLALLPFATGFVALFQPSSVLTPELWLVSSLLLCTLGFSACTISYQAWGGDLGTDTPSRLRFTAARECFGLCGVVIAAVLPVFLAADVVTGLGRMWWLFIPLLIFCAAFSLLKVPDVRNSPVNKPAFINDLTLVLSDTVYRRLAGVFVINGIASAFPATLFVFFVSDVLDARAQSGLFLGLYFLSAAAAIPLWVKIALLWGRPRTWLFAMTLAIAAFSCAFILGQGDLIAFTLICIVSGAAVGADLTIPSSIVADLGERTRRAGAYFGIWNLLAKFSLAFGAGVSLPLLDWAGYQPGTGIHVQSLVAAYVLLPIMFKSVAIILLLKWTPQFSFRD